MAYNSFELLVNQLEEQRKSIIEALGDGSAKDFGAYQHAVGMVRGLLTAQSLISDLARNIEEADD
jgi:hypothetical protein